MEDPPQKVADSVSGCFHLSMTALLWPVCYRVTPHRLGTLRYGFLGRRPRSHHTEELPGRRIIAWFDELELEIESTQAASQPSQDLRSLAETNLSSTKIRLTEIAEPHAFVETVFRAAMCETAAPALPTDELLA